VILTNKNRSQDYRMSASGLEDPQTKTSLGFTSGGGSSTAVPFVVASGSAFPDEQSIPAVADIIDPIPFTPLTDGTLVATTSIIIVNHADTAIDYIMYLVNGDNFGENVGHLLSGIVQTEITQGAINLTAGSDNTLEWKTGKFAIDSGWKATWSFIFYPTPPSSDANLKLKMGVVNPIAKSVNPNVQTAVIKQSVDKEITIQWDKASPNQAQLYWG